MASRKWIRIGVLLCGGLVAGAAGAVYVVNYSDLLKPPVVTTAPAMVAPVSEAVYGTGVVEPERWAKVVPLQRRRLVDICRCEGQSVRAGQVLARQDDAEERSVLQELEINHEQLDRNLRRAQDERKRNEITKAELEQRETQFEQSKSRIAAQRTRLDTLVLRAPMDGMVLRRDGEVGEIVGPTEVPFWVGQPMPLLVVAEINEEEIVRIAVGQKAFLRTEAFQGRSLLAEVSQITPKGDPTRKTFRVYLRLPHETPLRIGMTVEANIIFREKPAAIVVPVESVVSNAVQVVNNGVVQRVPVSVGIKGSRTIEVSNNIARGALVLSPGRPELKDGTKVTVNAQPPGSLVIAAAPATGPALGASAGLERSMHPPDLQPRPPDLQPRDLSSREPQPVASPEDREFSALSAAMTAHIESVVMDARRNLHKLGTR